MPNWRKILAGAIRESSGHLYCGGIRCGECIFNDASKWCLMQYIPNNQLLEIDYHLLETVEDWSDTSEIKTRIAEMLDDPEKFLGKAEPEPKPRYWVYKAHYSLIYSSKPFGNDMDYPEFRYLIIYGTSVIAALGDKDAAEKVADFLNGDTK